MTTLPQLLMLLKRTLMILMDRNVALQWKGIWTWPEPAINELRQALPSYTATLQEEPWLRQFVESALDLLQMLEESITGEASAVANDSLRL